MKRIKHILLASVLLLVGLFAATGCDEKDIKLNFLDNVTEITYSVYQSDDMRTHVTDKEDIALLSSFFYDSEYKKITEEDLNEDISKNIIIEVTSEEGLYNISVYPDGNVSAIIKGVGYISTSSAANYNGLLNKTQELRVEYEQYENTYFLRDVEDMEFSLSPGDSTRTEITTQENKTKVISLLSAGSYRKRLYGDPDSDLSKELTIRISTTDYLARIYVSENIATVYAKQLNNEEYEYFISDGGINYEELSRFLKQLRNEWWENIKKQNS